MADPQEVRMNPAQGGDAVFGQSVGNGKLLVAETIVFYQPFIGTEPNDPGGILKNAVDPIVLSSTE
jgi:hypothetical protein